MSILTAKKINAHAHLLPKPEQIPNFMREQGLFWIDADRKYMRQGTWQRPVTHPSFFLEEKLNWMAKNEIDHEVVLNLSQLYCNGWERETARDVIRFQNDFNASIQAEYPDQFTSGFVVQALHLEDALKEIDRCVNELNLRLLCLPTHYINSDQQWTSIADPALGPLWELANQHQLAIEIHPYDASRMIALKDQYWRFHLVWMCAQTADTYHIYTLLNFPQKYPDTRVCFAHGNQFGQINVGRRIQGFEGRPDLFEGTAHPGKSLKRANIFFDTLVHDVYAFRLLLDRQGVDQIVAGIDDPYPLGEMETVPGSYPGKVIDEAVDHGFITEAEKGSIWRENVLAWLGAGLLSR